MYIDKCTFNTAGMNKLKKEHNLNLSGLTRTDLFISSQNKEQQDKFKLIIFIL